MSTPTSRRSPAGASARAADAPTAPLPPAQRIPSTRALLSRLPGLRDRPREPRPAAGSSSHVGVIIASIVGGLVLLGLAFGSGAVVGWVVGTHHGGRMVVQAVRRRPGWQQGGEGWQPGDRGWQQGDDQGHWRIEPGTPADSRRDGEPAGRRLRPAPWRAGSAPGKLLQRARDRVASGCRSPADHVGGVCGGLRQRAAPQRTKSSIRRRGTAPASRRPRRAAPPTGCSSGAARPRAPRPDARRAAP